MRCLVFDLGAGSGRAMLVELQGETLSIRTLTRFTGYEVRAVDGPAWDIDIIRAGIREGLARAADHGEIASVAVDSWGVDFVLIDVDGAIVDPPRTYRHPRGGVGLSALSAHHERIAARTGLQIIPIATLFHLSQWARDNPEKLAQAEQVLMIADYFAFALSGVARSERTLARTTGFLSVATEDWDDEIVMLAGLPRHIFGPIVPAGTVLGPMQAQWSGPPGLAQTKVVSVAGHDTACAAFALAPLAGEAFAVCGSWNLFGVEVPAGTLPAETGAWGFGLEGGIGSRAVLDRAMPGLFLMRRLRDSWAARGGETLDFPAISALALDADPATPAIAPSDPVFFDPVDMVGAMEGFLPALAGAGIAALARSLYVGLAREAAETIRQLAVLSGEPIHTIRVGGGGSQDVAWMQLLAEETGCEVVAGPVEASVVGNALIQLTALGAIPSLEAAQALARRGAGMQPVTE
ncbi:rhamnulokinase [Rhizobium sp. RU20A]|uniref:rhamnulokinase n=1 Tax=Rhizobium sp. RU20A TaxID=1907412 RepID=UPI0009549D94|nr:FGGY family carbohydrate kinase [Rhizobium sp. RU20A]SIQ96796.1 rhamnulokinase [Rhizobium sp. RU20A]